MKKHITLALSLFLATAALYGQTDTLLIRTVVVENTYNPAIMDANKINVLPTIEEPKVAKKEILYLTRPILLSSLPTDAMGNIVAYPVQPTASRGWGNIGYGYYGNLAMKIAYRATLAPQDELHLSLGVDGMQGTMKNRSIAQNSQRFYDTDLSLRYAHQFNSCLLGAKGNLGLQCFNYGPDINAESDKQDPPATDLALFFRSTALTSPWQYGAQVTYNYFHQAYQYYFPMAAGLSESQFVAQADASYRLANGGVIALGVSYDLSRLSTKSDTSRWEGKQDLAFNPSYSFERNTVQLRLGAKVDITNGFDQHVYVAPDVFVGLPFAECYMFYVEGTGGISENTLRDATRLSPYWQLSGELKNTYVPLATEAGFKASVAEGVNVHIFGGFKIVDDDLLIDGTEQGTNLLTTGDLTTVDMGFSFRYLYMDYLDLTAQATYNLWKCNDALKPMLYTKPVLDTNITAKGAVRDFSWEIAYQFATRYKQKMNPINDLSLRIAYRLPYDITAWAKADNLLCKSYQYHWSIPSERFNLMLGASLTF